MEGKTYRSYEEVSVEHHQWLTKGQRMIVRVDGKDLLVDRFLFDLYDRFIASWVIELESPGRYSMNSGIVLSRTRENVVEGWDSEEKFIECAQRAWFLKHMHPDTKAQLEARSDAIREKHRKQYLNKVGHERQIEPIQQN